MNIGIYIYIYTRHCHRKTRTLHPPT